MASTIVPTNVRNDIPPTGNASTVDVLNNFTAIRNQFTAAANDINDLYTKQAQEGVGLQQIHDWLTQPPSVTPATVINIDRIPVPQISLPASQLTGLNALDISQTTGNLPSSRINSPNITAVNATAPISASTSGGTVSLSFTGSVGGWSPGDIIDASTEIRAVSNTTLTLQSGIGLPGQGVPLGQLRFDGQGQMGGAMQVVADAPWSGSSRPARMEFMLDNGQQVRPVIQISRHGGIGFGDNNPPAGNGVINVTNIIIQGESLADYLEGTLRFVRG